MSESDPIDLSNLQNLQFRPSWVEDLAKSDVSGGEVIWGRAPGGSSRGERDDRPRPGGGPRRDGVRSFDRNDRGPRPESRAPRPEFRGPPPGQGERRPPPRGDGQGPPRGERREGGPVHRGPRPDGPRRDDRGGRPPFRGGEYRDQRDQRDMPPPLQGWQVSLVPDQRSVEAIARQIKASGRAFSVFDVGRLFMDSRERYQVRFRRQAAPPAQQAKEGDAPAPAPAPPGPEALCQCQADGSLWLTRDEAIRHLLNSPALTKYYRAETVTMEAPKGVWNSVAVCGFSGTLLGPPNHHEFQRNVARLHRERFSDMSLDRYKSRIRTEKDEALLLKWQEQQSTATQWVAVSDEPLPEGAEPPAAFKSVSEMEAHFLRTHATGAVVAVTSAMVSGNIPGKCISPALLTLLRREVENQQRFPMQLVQDLCRALESQGLRFFKRDKKTTCVCRNRPHFLPDDLVLSERVRSLVEMVRANPGITYSRLVSTLAPHIVPASASPPPAPSSQAVVANEAAAVPEAAAVEEIPVAAESPATAEVAAEIPVVEAPAETEAAPAEDAPSDISATADEVPAAAGPDNSAAADSAPESEAPPSAPPAPAPAPAPHLSPEEIAILQDLHWLVQEGYVTEFQSGELFVLGRPPQPPVERKPRGPRPLRPAAEGEAAQGDIETGAESVGDPAPAVTIEEPAAAEESPAAVEDSPPPESV